MSWLEKLAEFAHGNLKSREALWDRGVSDAQIDMYQIGYINAGLPPLENADAFLRWWQGHRITNSFVFPMTNALGKIKGFQFRSASREKKGYLDYVALKDEPAYFGLSQAMPAVWQTQEAYIVEGAYDLFPIQRLHANSFPTMTSDVSTALLRFLRRNIKVLWVCYDMDFPGQRGSFELCKDHAKDFDAIHVIKLPRLEMAGGKKAKDPGDLWETLGDKAFGDLFNKVTSQLVYR